MRLLKLGALGLALLVARTASAQVQAGSIQGTVTDQTTGTPMLLVTVVASSPALQGTQSEFTDESGQFFMNGLPAGSYSLLFIYGDSKVKRENVEVGIGKATVVNAKMNTQAAEVITIKTKAPTIDAASTKQGTTLQQDYMKNIPSPGRTYQGVLGAASGSQADQFGTSFSGSTSVENSYVVDGVNTSGVTLGAGFPTQGSAVLNNFIQEIEVITGGYNAEFGRSTGGVVNVVTKTGSNEFHGSVFANVQALNASAEAVPVEDSALRGDFELPRTIDFGFELGGPIIKDRLWFYVGFAPVLNRTNVTRVVQHNVDRNRSFFNYNDPNCQKNTVDNTCDGDGNPLTTSVVGCELMTPPPGLQSACEEDGTADFGANGLAQFEEIERRELTQSVNTYQFTAKLNLAVAPEHQGQISLTGTPYSGSNVVGTIFGTPTFGQRNETQLNTDTAVKWTSKLFDNKTQIDALVGWHRFKRDAQSINERLPADQSRLTRDTPSMLVTDFTGLNGFEGDGSGSFASIAGVMNNTDTPESERVQQQCEDGGSGDAFKQIKNCPLGLNGYGYNSRGFITDTLEQRWTGKLSATQRVKALGHHQFKGGIDFESNLLDDARNFTGGYTQANVRGGPGRWQKLRFAKIDEAGSDYCANRAGGDLTEYHCDYLKDLPVHGNTLNYGAFIQDSWSILPNLTINAGLRYEQQYLKYSDQVVARHLMDPITDKSIGKNAMSLTDLFAPRIGLIYDWTKEGRSKIYANWGRFYEAIPMDINNRSFGGEVTYFERWNYNKCGNAGNTNFPLYPSLPEQCPTGTFANDNGQVSTTPDLVKTPSRAVTLGAADPAYGVPNGISLVMPDTSAQYLDELVLGVEYEVLEDLRVGVNYQNRRLGRVIEDLSTDGANTYFIGNPGEFSDAAEKDLLTQIAGLDMNDPRREQLKTRLQAFEQTRRFDTPQRVYNAVQLTAAKRFSKDFMVQGSYTYSVLKGNYPGLFSPDTGQLDPNITSMYDLFELLGNRNGKLPFDRPHAFKLDGYYKFDLKEAGHITTGMRLRAQSGVPITPLGSHVVYGAQESFILPRGSDGRTAFETGVDLHAAYGRKIGDSMQLEVFFELFNVINRQGEVAVDQQYTGTDVDPIIGGTKNDLFYLKGSDPTAILNPMTGESNPVSKNLNYANTSAKQAPLSARIGLNLAF